jgi:hypothetical protein
MWFFLGSQAKEALNSNPITIKKKKKKKKQKLSHGISIAKKLNKKTQF